MAAGRSFERPLRQCRRALELLQMSHPHSTRYFSDSARHAKNGSIPVFVTTESPELNDLLSTIRSKVMVPSHLNNKQKKLVYKKKNISMLTAEPFIVEIGSNRESIQLEHIDRTKDLPSKTKTFMKCMDLMGKSPKAWRNLLPLLQGYKTAKRIWSKDEMALILRTVGERGMAHLVVKAAQMVRKTNIRLFELAVVREAFWSARVKAMQSGWEEQATSAALSYGKQLADLLERDQHTKSPKNSKTTHDARVQPDIIGILLELAAIRSSKHLGGKDEDGDVAMYAARLLPNIDRAAPLEKPKKPLADWASIEADYELLRWVPILTGLRLAKEILGDTISKLLPQQALQNREVDDIISDIEKRVGRWKDIAEKQPAESRSLHSSERGLEWLGEIN